MGLSMIQTEKIEALRIADAASRARRLFFPVCDIDVLRSEVEAQVPGD
ncbi:MAG: hypothetical protein V2B19_01400 [Pseudomonadota bacterium]